MYSYNRGGLLIKAADTWKRNGQCAHFPSYIVYFDVCSYSAFPSCVGPISCLNWQPQWKVAANFQLIQLFGLAESRGQSGKGKLTVWVEVREMGWLFKIVQLLDIKQRWMKRLELQPILDQMHSVQFLVTC